MTSITQRSLFYAMGGVFTEVLFTSIKTFYYHQDYTLHGYTQLWVILMYIFGGLLFEKIYSRVTRKYLRIFIFTGAIYIIEYSCGWILQTVLGECPWEYSEPGNVHGLIQLSYAPLWVLFSAVTDKCIYVLLNYRLKKISTNSKMSGESKGWLYSIVGDYKPNDAILCKLIEYIEAQERKNEELAKAVERAEKKIDKLIECNRNLIAHFDAVDNRNARDLNYRIRSFSSKKHLDPVGFVPTRRIDT